MNATLDLTPIVQPIIAVIGAVIAGMIAIYVPRALSVLETRTGIKLTDQQRETVLGAVNVAAGILETKLDQGAMRVEHVTVKDPRVLEQAQAVVNTVPVAGAALGLTIDGAARMIVGMVDTQGHRASAPVPVGVDVGPAANVIPVGVSA